MISTKGGYVLREMIDLAEYACEEYIPMEAIVGQQGISLKYLEPIFSAVSFHVLEAKIKNPFASSLAKGFLSLWP